MSGLQFTTRFLFISSDSVEMHTAKAESEDVHLERERGRFH